MWFNSVIADITQILSDSSHQISLQVVYSSPKAVGFFSDGVFKAFDDIPFHYIKQAYNL